MNGSRTLLIVDDEEGIRDLLLYELRNCGAELLTADTGRSALSLIQSRSPCLVISDINMPEMTGLELLKEVRGQGLHTPFIFLTAFGDKEKAIAAFRLGAVDFIDKPYQRAILQKSVEEALKQVDRSAA